MRPEDVPAELVEKAAEALAGLPYGLGGPGARVVAMFALAAVLPEIQAQALREARDGIDDAHYDLDESAGVEAALRVLEARLARLTATTEGTTT